MSVGGAQALAGGADSSEDEGGPAGGHSPTYVQEQEALRRGFLEVCLSHHQQPALLKRALVQVCRHDSLALASHQQPPHALHWSAAAAALRAHVTAPLPTLRPVGLLHSPDRYIGHTMLTEMC